MGFSAALLCTTEEVVATIDPPLALIPEFVFLAARNSF
jgi:hypothetical protein